MMLVLTQEGVFLLERSWLPRLYASSGGEYACPRSPAEPGSAPSTRTTTSIHHLESVGVVPLPYTRLVPEARGRRVRRSQ